MSITEILIKVVGVVLALVGLGLVLSAVGVSFLVSPLSPGWVSIVVGLILLAIGIYIVRGGRITL